MCGNIQKVGKRIPGIVTRRLQIDWNRSLLLSVRFNLNGKITQIRKSTQRSQYQSIKKN